MPCGGLPFEPIDAMRTNGTNASMTDDNALSFRTVLQDGISYNNGVIGAIYNGAIFLALGDSLLAGNAATAYTNSYGYLMARSIWNAPPYNEYVASNYGYQSSLNMDNFLSEVGVSTVGGSLDPSGVCDNTLELPDNAYVTMQLRTFNVLGCTVDADRSTGDIVFTRNDVEFFRVSVSGTGIQYTDLQEVNNGNPSLQQDQIKIVSDGGTLFLTSVQTLKQATSSPIVLLAAQSGTGIQTWADDADKLDLLATYYNLQRPDGEKVFIPALGTNNIYNEVLALSPEDYVIKLDLLITEMGNRVTSMNCAIPIPPKADEDIWPPILAPYNDYRDAIIAYCVANNYQMIRHDLSLPSRDPSLLPDGLHGNNTAHRIWAQDMCDGLGIVLNGYYNDATTTPAGPPIQVNQNVTMNDTWGAFTNNTDYRLRATTFSGFGWLSGVAQPNGSSATLIGTLPAGTYNTIRNIIFPVCMNDGVDDVVVKAFTTPTGELHVESATAATISISFDGISYPLNNLT